MTRSFHILYIAVFLGILLSLGVWSIGGLVSFDRTPQATLLNGRLAKAAENHYDAEFPIKRLGTNLWAVVDFELFHEGRPGVVLGKRNWLFSDEEFNPVANGDQHEQENFALIQGVRDTLKAQGIQLVLAIIPSKARVYPEYLANQTPASEQAQLYQQFHAKARTANLLAPDLLEPLLVAKHAGPVFLRTDTHWTPMGAEVVAQQLGAAIAQKTPLGLPLQHFVTEARPGKPYQGDLTTFLPLDPLFSELMPKPDVLQKRTTRPASEVAASAPDNTPGTAPVTNAQSSDSADALFADTSVPVALVGTSYSANKNWNFLGALKQAIGSDVVNFAEIGHGPILPMLRYLQSDDYKNSPPKVVIWEFPERYLPVQNDLSEFDSKWITGLEAAGSSNAPLALNAAGKTETPSRAQN